MLVMFLQLMGHQLFNCNTPSAALDALARNQFQAVLLDIGLPDMDGYQLAQEIRRRMGAAQGRRVLPRVAGAMGHH